MTHSSGEGLALDVDHHGRIGDHTARGLCTGLADLHVLHASKAISDCEPTGPCLQPRICYESYSTTETLLYSALLLHGAKLGSAPDLDQLLIGKVGSTPLSGLQLRDSGLEFVIPESEAESVDVDWIQEHAVEHAHRVRAGDSPVKCAQPSWPGAPPPRPGPQGFLQR